jgi:hypothetical protein
LPNLPPIGAGSDGYLITGLAQPRLACLADAYPDLRLFVRRHYDRAYERLDGGADAYLARFSGKTRSTLRRKTRRLAERCGGALDLRRYAAPGEMEAFHCHARAVSVLTYQERLLDLGMPDGDSAVAQLKARAQRNEVRGWVLFVRDRPIAYLHAPAEGDVLILGHLGYDPAFAAMSPGTVLMFEAMRQLAAEGADSGNTGISFLEPTLLAEAVTRLDALGFQDGRLSEREPGDPVHVSPDQGRRPRAGAPPAAARRGSPPR